MSSLGAVENPSTPQMTTANVACQGCNVMFKSRNAVFKHLYETDGACLSGQAYVDYCKYVRPKWDKQKKNVILYGYVPSPTHTINNGDDAAQILLRAIHKCQEQIDVGIHYSKNNTSNYEDDNSSDNSKIEPISIEADSYSLFKINRSYGNASRNFDSVKQDHGTGAISEVLATKLYPLRGGRTVEQWIDHVQYILDQSFALSSSSNSESSPIRVLGRESISSMKFNAETDVTHRRVEYFMPIDFLTFGNLDLKQELESIPTFAENSKRHNASVRSPDFEFTLGSTHSSKSREFLQGLKKVMHALATQIIQLDMNDKGAVMEKEFNVQKRRALRWKNKNSKKEKKPKKNEKGNDNNEDDDSEVEEENNNTIGEGGTESEPMTTMKGGDKHRGILKRRRFHNFTPRLMAHDYMTYRRLDRIWHRSTERFSSLDQPNKTFITLSMTGDMFLTGQITRIIGLFLAIANGVIDPDIVDCVFDEEYSHLVPTPPAPILGVLASEATYMTWEGKFKTILNPRVCHVYDKGFNQSVTLERVKSWQEEVHETLASRWLAMGTDGATGRLLAEKEWTENVLIPWGERARVQLDHYRKWVNARNTSSLSSSSSEASMLVPPIELIDASIPEAFQEVLSELRKIDISGTWPSTTLKRQLVMISTTSEGSGDDGADGENKGIEKKPASISEAHVKAKNNKEKRSCAYSFKEGQGGASGSFSVGYMPGVNNHQPKSNYLFPDLVKAAFKLERRLFPNREPSSTIAINRNAQFRPHTDSGAGVGQSTSLIVGLGTYAGGELMVEGEQHDIRYKAIEFNGWKQRHWTMPFKGERYSLVWFTPKGCEGKRGIDLDFSTAATDVE